MEQQKEKLNVAICGNAESIAAYVEYYFKDKYDLNFCVTEEAFELLSYANATSVDIFILSIENIVPVYTGHSNDYKARYNEILQLIAFLKEKYNCRIFAISKFNIPQSIYNDIHKAGADCVIAGPPMYPVGIILNFLDALKRTGHIKQTESGNILQGKKVLIVDDELGIRESLRMILKPYVFTILAESGEDALAILKHNSFDLITTNLRMDGMNGIDLCREIRERGMAIPIVIITGYGTLGTMTTANQYGVADFISKPFKVTDIIEVSKKALHLYSNLNYSPIKSQPIATKPLQRKKILMIEDEDVFLECYHSILEPEGAIIKTAENGKEAFKLLYRESFDLITTNIGMPVMDGISLCKIIREKNITTPIVVISGHHEYEAMMAINPYDVTDYICKPWKTGDLIRRLEKALTSTHADKLKEEVEPILRLRERAKTPVQEAINTKHLH